MAVEKHTVTWQYPHGTVEHRAVYYHSPLADDAPQAAAANATLTDDERDALDTYRQACEQARAIFLDRQIEDV